MELTPCPHCGQFGLMRMVRAYGWAEEQLYRDGEVEIHADRVRYTRTKTIRCLECGKIRRDVKEWPPDQV